MAIEANPPLYQLSFLKLTNRSYEEALHQLVEAIEQGPINLRDLPSLSGRVMHLTLAALLIIPIINNIVLIVMEHLGMYVTVPPVEEEVVAPAPVVEIVRDQIPEELVRDQIPEELVQILDEWIAGSPSQSEQRNQAKLRVLECYRNQSTQLNLAALSLSSLPVGIFARLHNLRKLYLNLNQLKELPPGIFTGLHNLTELNVCHNLLNELLPGVFTGLHNLRKLYLNLNQLKELPPGIFTGLNELIEVDFSENQLPSELPMGTFAGLNKLIKMSY